MKIIIVTVVITTAVVLGFVGVAAAVAWFVLKRRWEGPNAARADEGPLHNPAPKRTFLALEFTPQGERVRSKRHTDGRVSDIEISQSQMAARESRTAPGVTPLAPLPPVAGEADGEGEPDDAPKSTDLFTGPVVVDQD